MPKQQIRARFLNFLKHYFNPFTRRLAMSSIGPFSIIRHVGRKSGKEYETPLIIRRSKNGFVAELTYGPNVDWYKNVVAANGCKVLWHGKNYTINGIKPLDTKTGMAAFPFPMRMILKLGGRHEFVELLENSAKP